MVRTLLSKQIIRNFYCFIRAFYFIKILKKLKKKENISQHVWEKTVSSNLRHVYDEGILPDHPNKIKQIFGINLKFRGGNIDYLFNLIKEMLFYCPSSLKNTL